MVDPLNRMMNQHTTFDRIQFRMGDREKLGFFEKLLMLFDRIGKQGSKDLGKSKDQNLVVDIAAKTYLDELKRNPKTDLAEFKQDLRSALTQSKKVVGTEKQIDETIFLIMQKIKGELENNVELKEVHEREKGERGYVHLWQPPQNMQLSLEVGMLLSGLEKGEDIHSYFSDKTVQAEVVNLYKSKYNDNTRHVDKFCNDIVSVLKQNPTIETEYSEKQWKKMEYYLQSLVSTGVDLEDFFD